MPARDSVAMQLAHAIAAGDSARATQLLTVSPSLATAHIEQGATRLAAAGYFLDDIRHYVYAGDTALHIAAASYQVHVARELIDLGADVHATNRRGAQPLHYAADGGPGSPHWDPDAQAATIAFLVEAGADPNAVDNSGVAPLHRAVRGRCAAAVQALLDGGADPMLHNASASTPLTLATHNTGKAGSGSAEAKAQQQQIIELLERHGA